MNFGTADIVVTAATIFNNGRGLTMLLLGFCLMAIGLTMGFVSIYKAAHYSISAAYAGWLCYGGLFVALIGAVCVGKIL